MIPATVLNTDAAALTITGAGFVSGVSATLGSRPFADLRVISPTQLAVRLPSDTCPGTYPITVRTATGQTLQTGSVTVQGVRTATIASGQVTMPPIRLDAREQQVLVALPDVLVQDTTCAPGDWRLAISVADFTQSVPNRQPLTPSAIQVGQGDGTVVTSSRLTAVDGRSQAELVVPRPVRPGPTARIALKASVQLVVPPTAFAGQYTTTARVQLLEAR